MEGLELLELTGHRYALHDALFHMCIDNHVYGALAYDPSDKGNMKHFHDGGSNWRVLCSIGFGANSTLKMVGGDGKPKLIRFNFGIQETQHFSSIRRNGFAIYHNYQREKMFIEQICKISDEGYDIVCGSNVLLSKNKGSDLLIDIDLMSHTYAHLDEPIPF